ncbi:UPF0619 GPI-anchored membrane protein [Penicillium chrysogenum]|uniref:UPF0619 GPI-anchored membrane protein n=1 Tax=Penicillium chrysogenum TaxID=5076 RepID=A0A162BY15_PENCH|nr:uncharacterized protein N7525_011278 [Penicillium rubens]KAJ5036926.1 hypothetical protein NUH16_004807 [Penicillium rubens]KAJ5821994.1 hypothetical protein N7525_011278 [Penicillium rubens]KAJ5859633.1 hypothetical protein N7534_004910 [Penicillium rubens]KZN83683.1 UPF0619 GPI-anchored membrane protein [Penicillium chrysogenum]
MRFATVLALLPLALSVGAIKVTEPAKNDEVDVSGSFTVKWSSVSTDASTVDIVLVNNAVYPPVEEKIASGIDTSKGSYTASGLKDVTDGSGFQINLISTEAKNTGILAQSEQFDVTESDKSSSSATTTGTSSTVSSASSTASAASTSVVSTGTTSTASTSAGVSSTETEASSTATGSTSTGTTTGTETSTNTGMTTSASSATGSASGSASASASPTPSTGAAMGLVAPGAAAGLLAGVLALNL